MIPKIKPRHYIIYKQISVDHCNIPIIYQQSALMINKTVEKVKLQLLQSHIAELKLEFTYFATKITHTFKTYILKPEISSGEIHHTVFQSVAKEK